MKRLCCVTGLAGASLVTGCALNTQPRQKFATKPAPTPGVLVPNLQVNPVVTITSELPDPYIFHDTVQRQEDNPVSLPAAEHYQTMVSNYVRTKFPLTANSVSASSNGPKIAIWLTFLDFHARWSISKVFTVEAVVMVKADVKTDGGLRSQTVRATGQAMGDNAFQGAMDAALRHVIPLLDSYLVSLKL